MPKIPKINAVMYECGHIEALKDIDVNDMLVLDMTLRLPGKCHTCRKKVI